MEACGRAAVMGYSLQQPISVKGSAFPLRGEMKLNGVKLWSVKPCKASHLEGSLVTGRPPPSVSVPIPEMSGRSLLSIAFPRGSFLLIDDDNPFPWSELSLFPVHMFINIEHIHVMVWKRIVGNIWFGVKMLNLILQSKTCSSHPRMCLHVRPAGSTVYVVSESLDETGGHVKPTRPLLHVLFYMPRESLSCETSHE
ncbi:hypothetical protein FXO37_13684 [Capsicum annuum]|nr:hypothetical protein FXO37_13684 [Capsicum annuum]